MPRCGTGVPQGSILISPSILTNPPVSPGLSRILAVNPELPISALKIRRNPPHLEPWPFVATTGHFKDALLLE